MTTDTAPALDELAIAARRFLPLAALAPDGYAEKHASFEARSDQRRLLGAWLRGLAQTLPRGAAPVRVLSIGCGDGSLDLVLAAALAERGPVRYRGIEPHAPSAVLFCRRLGALEGVEVSVETVGFDAIASEETFDLVIAVHSLYYVASLGTALASAHARVAPGGRLVVVHAPREQLNSLVGVLAPGQRQEFADGVERSLAGLGLTFDRQRIEATLDLSRGTDEREWRGVVDFTVQAVIPDGLIGEVADALVAAAAPSSRGELLLAHPVVVLTVRR